MAVCQGNSFISRNENICAAIMTALLLTFYLNIRKQLVFEFEVISIFVSLSVSSRNPEDGDVHKGDLRNDLKLRNINKGSLNGLPSFEWKASKGKYKYLAVHFPDNGPGDVVALKRTNPIPSTKEDKKLDRCTFQGYLRDEQEVFVAVNGCPGSRTFEVRNICIVIFNVIE